MRAAAHCPTVCIDLSSQRLITALCCRGCQRFLLAVYAVVLSHEDGRCVFQHRHARVQTSSRCVQTCAETLDFACGLTCVPHGEVFLSDGLDHLQLSNHTTNRNHLFLKVNGHESLTVCLPDLQWLRASQRFGLLSQNPSVSEG